MSEIVHKQAIPLNVLENLVSLKLAKNAEILKVDNQNESLTFWYKVHHSSIGELVEERMFRVAGTGHLLVTDSDKFFDYIDSVQFRDGNLVFHVFEIKSRILCIQTTAVTQVNEFMEGSEE